ncbi:MAG TPA: FliM/FliN family flagellar motor switch protein [Sedimentisphaerales bacterium]|nr:FliM/FliN family flagellar motor switch protein [Phycisphaerae bacterium]HON91887.1 FliM/FliN family flagellar motor switch protein [Sedimentisphaerales bacterium]HQG48153.1 FliM/FliN family flagellar motor switch protein [Sedimentisphaerales bacterium]HQI26869.1 FliM/FliN family flagellar motor switch protein [Sedimentisphaerales bacterium]
MHPSIDHLGKTRIGQLLAAVGSVPVQETPARGDLKPYDWRDPHYLNSDQLNRLAAIMSQVAARLGDVFTRFFSRDFDVAPTAVTQLFGADLHRGFDVNDSYCQAFGPEKEPPCGFFAASSQTTLGWVSRLLGDTDSASNPNRSLSSLEESLLSDLVAAVVEVFLASLRPQEILTSTGRLSKGAPAIQFEPTQEICRITFQARENEKNDPSNLTFVLACDRLAALVGKTPPTPQQATAKELSQALMEHLQQMAVTVTARLATIQIGFQEILDLAPGDILLLDKSIHDLVELTIEGRPVFQGRPAQSDGHYAIVLKDSPTGQTAEPSGPKTSGEPKKG